MKVWIFTFFLLTLGLGKADTITQARQALLSSLHIAGMPKPPRNYDHALFERQTQAIETVGKYGNADDVELLIPYLDYPGPGAFVESPAETGEAEKTNWPAFGAIARIPHSTEQLYAYALDKNNPIDYRLTVLNMLRYVAPDSFKDCTNKIEATEADNTKLIQYIRFIQEYELEFRGIIHHEALDNRLKDLKMGKEQKAPSNP